MKLYLHIGTEKTGSSYLQTLLANNRKQLVEAGIYYPASTWLEDQMLRGEISAGNGQDLFEAIKSRNKAGLKKLLARLHGETRDKDCDRLLISNELLVGAFHTQENWSVFEGTAKEHGFTGVEMLLVLRNPAEQALSLYKHRAKSGRAPKIEEWMKSGYFLHRDLKNFLSILENNPINCIVRKYKKDPDYMDKMIFVDWLGIALPEIPVKKTVNPSLSLSELDILKLLQSRHPELKDELYKRLLRLPQTEKLGDNHREKIYMNGINNELASFNAIWQNCNRHLKPEEQIEVPRQVEELVSAPNILSFSEAQSKILVELMMDSLGGKLRWKLRYLKCRRGLGRIKQRVLSKKVMI